MLICLFYNEMVKMSMENGMFYGGNYIYINDVKQTL